MAILGSLGLFYRFSVSNYHHCGRNFAIGDGFDPMAIHFRKIAFKL